MEIWSHVFYFFGHHGAWSFVVLILIGIGLSIWRRKFIYIVLGFVLGMLNIFTGQFVNAWFLARFGETGSAVITAAEETNSTLNDQYIWEYEAVVRTADGKDVLTSFSTMTASLYPIRNSIRIPPQGERFVVRYIPGFEKNIVIMTDESPYGKRALVRENLKPVQKAENQYNASPDNKSFRKAYLEAMQKFLDDPLNATDTLNKERFRRTMQSLKEN